MLTCRLEEEEKIKRIKGSCNLWGRGLYFLE
jgi:hypothetical protein